MQFAKKPSKYFLNLEKQRIVEKTFVKLINDNGTLLQEENKDVHEIGTYYTNLYKYHANSNAE